MKIGVTASSGQLGNEMIKALKPNAGVKLVGIARSPDKIQQPGLETKKGDYNIKSELEKAFEGVDVLILIPGMDAPDVRIKQHRNVIEAAQKAGVQKIVFSSIIGKEGNSLFDPLLASYRQIEKELEQSGLDWIIGRNGLYIEPDVEYIEEYKKDGEVANCAGDSPVNYTTRNEIAFAYAQLALHTDNNKRILNLAGEAITQQQLTAYLNKTFNTNLVFRDMSPEAFEKLQRDKNGDKLGPVIAGIYTKIRKHEFFVEPDFEIAIGRKHISWDSYFEQLR